MTLQEKLDGFRANFETDPDIKTNLDKEALRVKNAGVEEQALKAGQRAPDFELPDLLGNTVSLAQLCAEGPLALDDLKARPRQARIFTLECSGNNGLPGFSSGIGNARWAGTPLAALLEEAGVHDHGIEVVFYGSDVGEEQVRGINVKQNFARSMSLTDAMNANNLLCYEMNGDVLPQPHGFPLRLIAPGWYGIAKKHTYWESNGQITRHIRIT